jgi:hypothetical protein
VFACQNGNPRFGAALPAGMKRLFSCIFQADIGPENINTPASSDSTGAFT